MIFWAPSALVSAASLHRFQLRRFAHTVVAWTGRPWPGSRCSTGSCRSRAAVVAAVSGSTVSGVCCLRRSWRNRNKRACSPAGGGPRRPSGRRRCGITAAPRKRADLVLSGGGIKGVALVGAVGALIDASGSPMTYAWRLRVKLRSTGGAHSLAPRPASPLRKNSLRLGVQYALCPKMSSSRPSEFSIRQSQCSSHV
jgi:hypothetical protein